MEKKTILQMTGITKEFSTVRVLEDVNLDIGRGEVHALIGANGAGKSTLMKILGGIYVTYDGEIRLDGQRLTMNCPQDAFSNGVAIIHQELDMVGNLSVAENIFLGRELRGGPLKAIDRKAMRRASQRFLGDLGFDIDAAELVERLPIAKQQQVMIARVVSLDAKVVVMDEPTSSLSSTDTENLFAVIQRLKKEGISVIYISHFLEEVFRVADRITVLRDGRKVITTRAEGCTMESLVEWMVGSKDVVSKTHLREVPVGEAVLEARGLTRKDRFVNGVSFTLRAGEVLGLAGVVGSGRSEIVRMIFGADKMAAGDILLDGKKADIGSPVKAVRKGIGFVPENRKTEGLVLIRSIFDNLSIPAIGRTGRGGVVNYTQLRRKSAEMVEFLKVKCESEQQEVRFLSGGNQQKVVIGKWLEVSPKVLILDQPTRGVDVGAKSEIYDLIDGLARQGCAVLFISDELEELQNLSDRILVVQKGRIVHEYDNGQRSVTKAELLAKMVG